MTVLLVASSGGHLQQLVWLRPWWEAHRRTWVTFDTPDARAMLAGEDVVHAWHPTNRSLPNLGRNAVLARRVLRDRRPDLIVSTGAAVAVPFFALAARFGARAVFVEPYDRVDRPSLTGRLVRRWADLVVVQHRALLDHHPGAVLLGPIRVIFVAVGTHHQRFDRLVRAAEQAAAALGEDLVTQGGSGDVLPPETFERYLREARVVVLHGGSSSFLQARALGRRPIVVPRRPERGEHVDDHQVRFVAHLDPVEAAVAEPEELLDAIRRHTEHRTVPEDRSSAFCARFGPLVAGLIAKRSAGSVGGA